MASDAASMLDFPELPRHHKRHCTAARAGRAMIAATVPTSGSKRRSRVSPCRQPWRGMAAVCRRRGHTSMWKPDWRGGNIPTPLTLDPLPGAWAAWWRACWRRGPARRRPPATGGCGCPRCRRRLRPRRRALPQAGCRRCRSCIESHAVASVALRSNVERFAQHHNGCLPRCQEQLPTTCRHCRGCQPHYQSASAGLKENPQI
jgi:hypothetical protein